MTVPGEIQAPERDAAAAPGVAVVGSRYRVLFKLGQGGTADVFLAVVHGPGGFNKLVVLKALKRTLARDPEHRRMFMAEARLSARLNHPNVVQVVDVFEQDGVPFMVMEYLEGKALSELHRLPRDRMPLRLHLRALADALTGLHYAHELTDYDGEPLGVVHRDLTPHNVFVTFDGRVKVLDFGIAKLASGQEETETGVIKGKLRYIPPEQISGQPVDRTADIYSAGVMLWEALTRQRLWQGLGEATVMNAALNHGVPAPSTVRDDVDPVLEAIAMRCLSRNPGERPPTAKALADELNGYTAAHEEVSARDLGGFLTAEYAETRGKQRALVDEQLRTLSFSVREMDGQVLLPDELATLPTKVTSTHRRRKAGSPAWPWLLAVAVAVIAAGAVAVGATRSPPEVPPSTPVAVPGAPEVSVHVTAFPTTATITIDGKQATGNPTTIHLPRDDEEHEIVVVADGHKERRRRVRLDTDVDIVISLDPLKTAPDPDPSATASSSAAPTPEPRPRPAARQPAAAPRPRPAPTPNCDVPYEIIDGIKRYKPACLK